MAKLGFIGSSMLARVPDVALRYLLAAVLIVVGGKFALDIPARLRPDVATSCGGALKGQYARNAVHDALSLENSHAQTSMKRPLIAWLSLAREHPPGYLLRLFCKACENTIMSKNTNLTLVYRFADGYIERLPLAC